MNFEDFFVNLENLIFAYQRRHISADAAERATAVACSRTAGRRSQVWNPILRVNIGGKDKDAINGVRGVFPPIFNPYFFKKNSIFPYRTHNFSGL